jgi:hypothetical protein
MSAESCFEAPVPFDLTFAAAHNLLRNVAHAVKEASSGTDSLHRAKRFQEQNISY